MGRTCKRKNAGQGQIRLQGRALKRQAELARRFNVQLPPKHPTTAGGIDFRVLHLMSEDAIEGPLYCTFLTSTDLVMLECTSRVHNQLLLGLRERSFAAVSTSTFVDHRIISHGPGKGGVVNLVNVLSFTKLMSGQARCVFCGDLIRRADLRVACRALPQQLTGTPMCPSCGAGHGFLAHTFDLVDHVVAAQCRASEERRVRVSQLRKIRLQVTKTGEPRSISDLVNAHYNQLTFIPDHLTRGGQRFKRESCIEDPSDEWIVLEPHLA